MRNALIPEIMEPCCKTEVIVTKPDGKELRAYLVWDTTQPIKNDLELVEMLPKVFGQVYNELKSRVLNSQ